MSFVYLLFAYLSDSPPPLDVSTVILTQQHRLSQVDIYPRPDPPIYKWNQWKFGSVFPAVVPDYRFYGR